ncbi:uncharacterized protein LOC141656455 [Silene latifolia]|uniref:uncharacterized protein LOC141656455 n=1 Tax=Silene latifolia TaxID=37657 RepID=UPI003D785C3C
MKFIEYVSCCVTSPQPRDTETTPSSTDVGRRKRRTSSTRGTSQEWEPSLFAITEDNAIAAVPEKKKPVDVRQPVAKPARPQVSKRNVNRCGTSSVQVNGPSRSYDYSRDPFPMVIPAFSAAPFMF